MAYATLEQFKSYLTIGDTVDDDELYIALNAAQAWISSNVRVFDKADTATARQFNVCTNDGLLLVDDISSLTDLAVGSSNGDGTFTAVTSGWTTAPLSALTRTPARPITGIQFTPYAPYIGPYGIQVTARWGWPAVPSEVTEATLLLASRLFKRKDSPQGVAGFGDLGVVRISTVDVDVRNLLESFMRPGIG